MRYLLTLLFLSYFSTSHAQLIPAPKAYDGQWVNDETSTMAWYMLRDTTTVPIGQVSTRLMTGTNRITVVTAVQMKGMQGEWIDSSTCERSTGSPIRHASYNSQRDMVLNFGKIVTGFYRDKQQNTNTPIRDTTRTPYFDSNFYPVLIRWLPLKEGFSRKIAIYDYNPSAKMGVISAAVKGVSSGIYTSKKRGLRDVWVVDVTDEISNAKSVYFIDKADRKLWKQTMTSGGRNMMMVSIE